jgi:phage terminase large subunit-like protein
MSFAGPTALFERLVIAGKLGHRGNPITTWQAGHVQVKTDANQNMRPVKPEHGDIKKIDGIVAGIMGLDASGRLPEESPYMTRGFLTT